MMTSTSSGESGEKWRNPSRLVALGGPRLAVAIGSSGCAPASADAMSPSPSAGMRQTLVSVTVLIHLTVASCSHRVHPLRGNGVRDHPPWTVMTASTPGFHERVPHIITVPHTFYTSISFRLRTTDDSSPRWQMAGDQRRQKEVLSTMAWQNSLFLRPFLGGFSAAATAASLSSSSLLVAAYSRHLAAIAPFPFSGQ